MKTFDAPSAEPPDPTPDFGPRHRGGLLALFVVLFCAFSAAGALLLLWREGYRLWAGLSALIFGGAAFWAGWYLVQRFRHQAALPRSHAVLTGALGFEIQSTCCDVAATVFFLPDRLRPGASTQLCFFVENHASRRRVARFRIGPHAGLGLQEEHRLALPLAAGQAAVYVWPLGIAPTFAAGEHDLPITLHGEKPTGSGMRLPGLRRHLYDLWTVHFAVPFTVDAAAAAAPMSAAPGLGGGRYLSLASVSEPAPRLDALNALVATAWGDSTGSTQAG